MGSFQYEFGRRRVFNLKPDVTESAAELELESCRSRTLTLTMGMRVVKWRFKTLVKIIIAVFVVTTFIVHYTNQKLEKTGLILKGIGSRDVKEMVQPFVDTFLLNYRKFQVDLKDGEEDPFLVVVVTSLPSHIERRNIIRKSWMQYKPSKTTLVVFFCGRPKSQEMPALQKESEEHGDLVVDDFEESYYGLTVKTLRILKWFRFNVPNAKFLVKTDDDVFVNTPKLAEYLARTEEKMRFESAGNEEKDRNYMGGVVFEGRSPHTLNTFSKWYVPPKLWKEEVVILQKLGNRKEKSETLKTYPPYLEGNFYVMSGHTVPLLLNTSLQLPLFHLEDVYLTGFIGSEILGIKMDSIPNLYTDSATFPSLNFKFNKLFTSPKNMMAYHFDIDVDLIKTAYYQSLE